MKQKMLISFIYYLLRLLDMTYRYVHYGSHNLDKAKKLGRNNNYIMATWHQDLISSVLFLKQGNHAALVSSSKDGEIMASVLERFKHIPARGSSRRGGKEGMLEMVKILNNGFCAAMANDGPTGPAKQTKPGTIQMAKLTGAAILPFSCMPKRCYRFKKSWDKFRIPYPFSKINISLGEPFVVEESISKEDFEKSMLKLNQSINDGEEFCKNNL